MSYLGQPGELIQHGITYIAGTNLVLPLAFFLAILLAYGQLYLNSEITVLAACGVSPRKLLHVALWPAAVVALLVGVCSLWLTPAGLVHNESMLDDQKQNADFSTLTPGRFQELGDRTAYTESLGDDARPVLAMDDPCEET